MSYLFLQNAVFFFFIVSTMLYVILDGFDLGLGCCHLFSKTDEERRLMLNAVGPVWDGNAVWIVISTGLLLAGFPKVYASVMSGLYLPIMVIVFGFLFRAAAIEFRSKKASRFWRNTWDVLYCLSSFGTTLFIGLILGNFVHGIPLDAKGELLRDKLVFFNLYAILITFFVLFFLAMHGMLYLLMKVEGVFQEKMLKIAKPIIVLFIAAWILATVFTFFYEMHMMMLFLKYPILILLPILSVLFIFSIPILVNKKSFRMAFLSSSLAIASMMALYGIGVYPNLVISSIDPSLNSLTLYNSSGTFTSLFVIFIVALCGTPLSFFYFSYIYKVFRGKVSLNHASY